MDRRSFISKVAAVVGVGVVAPAVLVKAVSEPRMPLVFDGISEYALVAGIDPVQNKDGSYGYVVMKSRRKGFTHMQMNQMINSIGI